MADLIIDNKKISSNYSIIKKMCNDNNLIFLPVTKCVRSVREIISPLIELGLPIITDVHEQNLSKWENTFPTALLSATRSIINTPYIPDVVYTADPFIINHLSDASEKVRFIIQLEMGGLREGILPWMFKNLIQHIDDKHINRITGFSTNYGCIHGITPDVDDINNFCDTSLRLSKMIQLSDPIIAAGGTILFDFLTNKQLPHKLTHIRMGESILFGFNTYTNTPIHGLENEIFTLQGEVIETKEVNTNIKGNNALNSFGEHFNNERLFMTNGIRKRAVINFGSIIADFKYIRPITNGIIICAQSYDHSVIDITDCEHSLSPGDVISFDCKYDAVVKAFHHPYTTISYKGDV